jgi:hypothetical protein
MSRSNIEIFLTGKNLLIILSILIIVAVCVILYRNYYKIKEPFAISLDDVDGTNAAKNLPLTMIKGMEGAFDSDTINEIFGGMKVKVAKDPLPDLCDKESMCSGIRDPFKLPIKQEDDSEGCGWYYIDDENKSSFPAYGNKDGPLSPKIRKAAQGGKWYFKDISGAQMLEDKKRCNRINSCKLADLYPTRCAWCENLSRGVPIEEDSKRTKYPDEEDTNCQGRLVYLPDNCKVPDKQIATILEDGVLRMPEPPPKDVCIPEDGKISRNCLIYIARGAGFSDNGNLIKILKKDPEGYTQIGTENHKKLLSILDLLKSIGQIEYNIEYFGNGNCNRKDVISYYSEIVALVTYGKTDEVRSAANWLVKGTYYDFDKCTSKMRGPYEISFLQRLFRKAGGQPVGKAYPKAENLPFYNQQSCTDIAQLFNKLCNEDIDSKDPDVQLDAVRKCLGINVTTPISGCVTRPKFTPNDTCNNIITSGSLLIGDVKADPNSGVEIFWYSWENDWNMPERTVPISTYLGREIRSTLPSFNDKDSSFCPFMNLNIKNLSMVVRTNVSNIANLSNTRFNVISNKGIAITVDNSTVMRNWASDTQGTGVSNAFKMNNGTAKLKIVWYNPGSAPKLTIQLANNDGKYIEIPQKNSKTRVEKGLPVVRFDFYNGDANDGNSVVNTDMKTSDLVFGLFQNKMCLLFKGTNAWVRTKNAISGSAFYTFTTMLFVSEVSGVYNQNRFFCLRQDGASTDIDVNMKNSTAIEGGISSNGKVNIMLRSSLKEDPTGINNLLVSSSEGAIKTNTWTHIAAVFTSCMTNCKLYIDGKMVAQGSNGNIKKGFYTDRVYNYGALGHGYSNWSNEDSPMSFKGGMAWARWFDYSLSDADVLFDKDNKFVDPNVYPGGQKSGWNVPFPTNNPGRTISVSNIPGCPAEEDPLFDITNPFSFTTPTAPIGPKEVFHVGGYNTSSWDGDSKCSIYNGAKLATKAQISEAQLAGADWCSTGWVADNNDKAIYPINVSLMTGCGNGSPGVKEWTPPNKKAGVNCYGIKPDEGKYPEIKPWTDKIWYQRDYIAPPPTNITNLVSSGITTTSFTLSWVGGTGATIYSYTNNGSAITPSIDNGLKSKTVTFSGLTVGTTYSIVVSARNSSGSTSSSPITVSMIKKRALITTPAPGVHEETTLATSIPGYLPGNWEKFNHTTIPSDLRTYSFVWFNNFGYRQPTYPSNITTIMSNYLVAGGTIFLTGENGAWNPSINSSIANFINQMGGRVSLNAAEVENVSLVTIKSKFLYNGPISPYKMMASGRFTSFGTGESIFTNSNAAGIWARGTLSAAPSGCIIAHLDCNAFEPAYARADYAKAIGEIVIRA